MALLKSSLDIAIRNYRLFSTIAPKAAKSWFAKFKELPVFSAFQSTTSLNNEQWTNLRTEILESKTDVRILSLDVMILRLCVAAENLELGKSYLKYLNENNLDISTAIIGKYFQLLYNAKNKLNDDDKKQILEIYDVLRIKHPLLDALTAESCILVTSLTNRWKECLELLEMIKISCSPSTASYSALIQAAFNNNEPEIAWQCYDELVKLNKVPSSDTYITYFDYCLRNFKDPKHCVEQIGKLFQFMADSDLIPDEIVVKKAKETFKTLGWVGTFTELSNSGVCQNCGEQLAPLKLSEQDFSHLSNTLFDKVLVGNDVYSRSTPTELQGFIKYVNRTKPYNVVIDGLNVAYKNRRATPVTAAKQLATMVRYFLDKNQCVLVLGRKHMLRWDKQPMNYIKNNSFLFLTDNLSADDPCLLYATLASGSESKFVSSDLMRQHKFLLGDLLLKRLFKRWQMSHQIFFRFNREKLIVLPPLNYLPVAQKGENSCWHVPYRYSNKPLTDSYEPPSDWLCLKKAKSRRK